MQPRNDDLEAFEQFQKMVQANPEFKWLNLEALMVSPDSFPTKEIAAYYPLFSMYVAHALMTLLDSNYRFNGQFDRSENSVATPKQKTLLMQQPMHVMARLENATDLTNWFDQCKALLAGDKASAAASTQIQTIDQQESMLPRLSLMYSCLKKYEDLNSLTTGTLVIPEFGMTLLHCQALDILEALDMFVRFYLAGEVEWAAMIFESVTAVVLHSSTLSYNEKLSSLEIEAERNVVNRYMLHHHKRSLKERADFDLAVFGETYQKVADFIESDPTFQKALASDVISTRSLIKNAEDGGVAFMERVELISRSAELVHFYAGAASALRQFLRTRTRLLGAMVTAKTAENFHLHVMQLSLPILRSKAKRPYKSYGRAVDDVISKVNELLGEDPFCPPSKKVGKEAQNDRKRIGRATLEKIFKTHGAQYQDIFRIPKKVKGTNGWRNNDS